MPAETELFIVYFLPVALLAYFIGGTVKGTVGLGMPITVVSLMSLVADSRTAVLLVLFPILVTNLWQCYQNGAMLTVYKKHWRLALSMSVTLLATSRLSVDVSITVITLSLGIAVICFASINLWMNIPAIHNDLDHRAQWTAGCITGVLGGLSGLVVIPLVIYFSARKLDKDTFIAFTCPFFFLGGCVLMTSYTSSGLFTFPLAVFSLLLVIPAVLGVHVGTRFRRTIPNEKFRRLVLFLFLLIGVQMVSRSIMV